MAPGPPPTPGRLGERLGGPGARSPEFGRFWAGEAASGMGDAITSLALQTLVLVTLSGSAAQVGVLNSVRWLPYLVLGLVVGALVDRVRRRPVMIVTDLLRAALLATVPLAWALDVLSFPLLLGVVLLVGVTSLFNDAASQSFVPRLVARADLQQAHARLDAAGAVAQSAGPAVAGLLIRLVGAPLAVLVDALTYLFSALMVATLGRVPDARAATTTEVGGRRLLREMGEGARWAYGGSGLARLAIATHVWFAGQATVLVLVVPYAYLELGLSALQVGLAFAVGGVGALIGALTTTAIGRRLGSGGVIIAAHAVSAVAVVVMLAATWVPTGWTAAAVLALGQLGHGVAMGASNSHEMSIRQSLTPDRLQARTNTTLRSFNRAVIVVVSPVVGLLADRIGFEPGLVLAAAFFVLSAVLIAVSPFRRRT